ncbi:hypothetical protein ACROYT_G040568 [Oculina patagonica]
MEYSKTPTRKETFSNESDDSDDEIIVKTLWPVHQAPTNGIRDYKDQDGDFQRSTKKTSNNNDKDDLEGKVESGNKENFKVNGETGGNSDAEDEVIEKVRRGRMEFPCSSECNASPAKSCLNGNSSSLCDNSHHKSKTSTTKANHPELSEDNRTILQSNSAGTKKKTSCHLS